MPSEDAKPVKVKAESKEEGEDKKTSGSRNVTKAASANAKSQPKVAKVKKEEPEVNDSSRPIKAANSASRSKGAKLKKEDNDDSDDNKSLSKRTSDTKLDKELKKKKKAKEGEKKSEPATEQKKRGKKVYDLPGQKRDPPEEKDPLRIFYETLYKQMPNSEMAQVWMMESGLLTEEVAKKVYEKKQKKGQQKVFSPVKAITAVKSSSKFVTVKKKTPSSTMHSVKEATDSTVKQSKKRRIEDRNSEDDSDDNFVLSKVKRRKAA